MSTGRLETFADGVFAIAATLLILSVDSHLGSCAPAGATLAHQLECSWPSYVAYVVSFLTIGIIWVNHHTVMDQIDHADRTFLMITVGFLMVVAFIPFPTRLVAENIQGDGARAATVAYGITLTLTAVLFNAIWFYAARGRTAAALGCGSGNGPRHLEDLRVRSVALPRSHGGRRDRSRCGRDRVRRVRALLGDRELGLRARPDHRSAER